jgi:hypothetical protein
MWFSVGDEYRTCRFCGNANPRGERMLKYGIRHWAHPICFLEKRGVDAIAALPANVIGQLPALPFLDRGVDLMELWEAAQAREAGGSRP